EPVDRAVHIRPRARDIPGWPIQALDHAVNDRPNGSAALGVRSARDLVQLVLCGLNHTIHLSALGFVAHVRDASPGLDQAAQYRLLADQARVVASTGRTGHPSDQGVQVLGAADARQGALTLKFGT